MKVSVRELVLLLVTFAVALFGMTAIMGRSKVDEWKRLRADRAALIEEIEQDERLLESRAEWEETFEALKAYLPQYPADKQMDAHWLSIMDSLASTHGVSIAKRLVGEEQRVGDIRELPIQVQDWSGSLDAVIHFLFDLQSQGAMLDVRQLLMKPNEQKELRGRFVLYCAYTRAEPGAVPASPPAPATAAAETAEIP